MADEENPLHTLLDDEGTNERIRDRFEAEIIPQIVETVVEENFNGIPEILTKLFRMMIAPVIKNGSSLYEWIFAKIKSRMPFSTPNQK